MHTEASEVYLCVVVSTLGTRPELRELLESLAGQSSQRFDVGIADQGSSQLVNELVNEFSQKLSTFVVRTGRRGLSRGRNDVIADAPARTTHFLFPNDTSRYPADFIERVAFAVRECDLAAVNYTDELGSRNLMPHVGIRDLRKEEVFEIIEPGMVLRASRVTEAGGFDETVGSGADSRRQSGEGTLLLLKMLSSAPVRIAWCPDIVVLGVSQHYRLSAAEVRRKERGYGFGYGFLLREWDFPKRRRVRAVLGPLMRTLLGRPRLSLGAAIASSLGRVEGMIAAGRGESTALFDAR